MADVNDASNIRGKYDNAIKKVADADIDERDRDAIQLFVRHRRADGASMNTRINDMSALRCAAERADTALVDMTKTTCEDFLALLAAPENEGGYGLDPDGSGMYNYKRAFRVFFRFLDERDDHGSYGFSDDLELPSMTFKPPSKDELLNEDEFKALKQATSNGKMTLRDRALIAFLGDLPRVTFAAQVRVGDVDVFDETNPTYRGNPDGVGRKGVGGDDDRVEERPIFWSAHEIRRWLSFGHPDPENDEAPLWIKHGYDDANPEEGALSTDGIRDMIARNADRAGIPEERATNPHAFRHVAVTRLRRANADPDHIRRVAGWSDMRMLDAYDHVTDGERNASLRSAAGLPAEAPDPELEIAVIECPGCGHESDAGARYCPDCGTPLDDAVRLEQSMTENETTDAMVSEDSRRVREALRAMQASMSTGEPVLEYLIDELGVAIEE